MIAGYIAGRRGLQAGGRVGVPRDIALVPAGRGPVLGGAAGLQERQGNGGRVDR